MFMLNLFMKLGSNVELPGTLYVNKLATLIMHLVRC